MKRTISYQTLTPMFIAGADKRKSEFRVPSLKGIMHYWWRAVQHANNLDVMRENEGKLFGSSETDIGRARFRLTATGVEKTNNQKEAMLPHKAEKRDKAFMPCFTEPFKISISSRNKKVLNQAIAVVELSAILGGLGKRSRRGFGAFAPVGGDGGSDQDEKNSTEGFIKKIQNLVEQISPAPHSIMLNKKNDTAFLIYNTAKSFDKLSFRYPELLEVVIKKTTKTRDNILTQIGTQSSYYAQGKYQKACGSFNPRQASPICFSFYRYKGHNYIVTALLSSSISGNRAKDITIQKEFRDKVVTYA